MWYEYQYIECSRVCSFIKWCENQNKIEVLQIIAQWNLTSNVKIENRIFVLFFNKKMADIDLTQPFYSYPIDKVVKAVNTDLTK